MKKSGGPPAGFVVHLEQLGNLIYLDAKRRRRGAVPDEAFLKIDENGKVKIGLAADAPGDARMPPLADQGVDPTRSGAGKNSEGESE